MPGVMNVGRQPLLVVAPRRADMRQCINSSAEHQKCRVVLEHAYVLLEKTQIQWHQKEYQLSAGYSLLILDTNDTHVDTSNYTLEMNHTIFVSRF